MSHDFVIAYEHLEHPRPRRLWRVQLELLSDHRKVVTRYIDSEEYLRQLLLPSATRKVISVDEYKQFGAEPEAAPTEDNLQSGPGQS